VRTWTRVLVQESWVNWPDSVYDKVGNILSADPGCDVRVVKAGSALASGELGGGTKRGQSSGGKPYPIPAGASTTGLVDWFRPVGQEVEQQENRIGRFFDTIIVCLCHRQHAGRMIGGFVLRTVHGE